MTLVVLVGACGDDPEPPPSCEGPEDCPEGWLCEDGVCEDPCEDMWCDDGQVCHYGECYDTSCEHRSCADGLICLDGACVSSDCVGVDCEAGESCADGYCYPDDCRDESCEGWVCVDDTCRDRACVGVSCPPRESCANGVCYATDCDEQDCEAGQVCVEGECTSRRCVGVSCPADESCDPERGVCTSGCLIDGQVYSHRDAHPENECLHCDPDVDAGDWTPVDAGASCSGDDYCTVEMTCDGQGTCAGGEPRDCSHLDEACAVGTCDSDEAACVTELLPEGTPCDDGGVCDDEGVCAMGCELPWGGMIEHGETVEAFASSTVGCEEDCESETRHCSYGELDGQYTEQTCEAVCQDCNAETLTWSTHGCQAWFPPTTHGESVTMDNEESGRKGEATYQCNDGNWVYESATCGGEGCDLPWGESISHGQSVTAYESSSVACGEGCVSQTRSCSYGDLSGSYTNQSCTEVCESCSTETLSWGADGCEATFGAAPHGETQTVENTASGLIGDATYSCNDGSWNFQSGTCEGGPCDLPWGGSIDHGETVTAYESESTDCEDFCPSEVRECSFGELLGDSDYEYQSCSVDVGTTCSDGSLYAGMFNDEHYYTLEDDQGEYTWNDGSTNWVATNATSDTDGQSNTAILDDLTNASMWYHAAVICYDLEEHGHSDWFLPAREELNMLWENRYDIGGFRTDGGSAENPDYYWSSTEADAAGAWTVRFEDGFEANITKNAEFPVRCVRR